MHVPLFNTERVLNEGACLLFLAQTGIPLPKLLACFEDDGAAYLVTEHVDGVEMNDLDAESQAVVAEELQRHIITLKKLTSDTWSGPDNMVPKHLEKFHICQANSRSGSSAISHHAKIRWATMENASAEAERPGVLSQ